MKYIILTVGLLLLFGCDEQKAVEKFYKDGYTASKEMNKIDLSPDIEIDVLGKQWDWIFTYSNGQKISCHESKEDYDSWKPKKYDVNIPGDMARFVTVPIKTLINFKMSSQKVLHSLAIPAFRVKKDAPVGKSVTMQFTATKIGTYIYTCNEVCGIDHGHMVGYIRVVSKEDYRKFIEELKKKPIHPKERGM